MLLTLVVATMSVATGVAVNLADAVHYAFYAVVVIFVMIALTAYLTQYLTRHRWRVLYAVALAAVIVAGPSVVNSLTGPPCPASCVNFEDGGLNGWGIRVEGDSVLGEQLQVSDARDRGGILDNKSLALRFSLRDAPRDKAQIKIENHPLTRVLSGWVYVDAELPSTLTIRGYVLEHREGAAQEWPYYDTNAKPLTSGGWTYVEFGVDQFAPRTEGVDHWVDPPLLVGFEIRDSAAGSPHGTVYFDQITIA